METDFTVSADLLGDAIIPEPALAFAGANDPRGYTNVHVVNPAARPLYEHNPNIALAPDPGGIVMNPTDAFWWAAGKERYFSEGYFPQVYLAPHKETRTRFRLHGAEVQPSNTIVICPFSGASGANGNKTNPPEWWDELIIEHLYRIDAFRAIEVHSLGSSDDPAIAGTVSKRGMPLRMAARAILEARIVVAIESFGIHVAGGKWFGRVVYLNSATPPALCSPPKKIARVIRAEKPKGREDGPTTPIPWDMAEIAAAVDEMLRIQPDHMISNRVDD